MALVKEFYRTVVPARFLGKTGAPHASDTQVIYRYDDGQALTAQQAAEIFNEIAAEFPVADMNKVRVSERGVSLELWSCAAMPSTYKQLPTVEVGPKYRND